MSSLFSSFHLHLLLSLHAHPQTPEEALTDPQKSGIAPGLFPSEMTTSNATNPTTQKSIPDTYASTNPAGRKGTDADMAATILFLAGRGGAFYNCQVLYPDGGMVGSVPAAV